MGEISVIATPLMTAGSGLVLSRLVGGWLQVGSVADHKDSPPDFSGLKAKPIELHLGFEELVGGLRRQDLSAQQRLVEQTKQACYRLAYSMLGDHQRVQDILQESYCLAFEKISQLQQPSALRGWLGQIVTNQCRQELRRRYRQDVSLEELSESLIQASDKTELRLAVQDTLSQLPLLERTTLALRELFDLSYQEIADTLGIPVGTVRSRIFNARKRFVELWGPNR